MTLVFTPSRAVGAVSAPPSKSVAHRLLFAAALAPGESRIEGLAPSDDIEATLACLAAFGARFHSDGAALRVTGISAAPPGRLDPDCRESGSTLRFLVPLALTLDRPVTFHGAPRLFARDLSLYETLCRERGFDFDLQPDSLTVRGRLSGGEFRLRGDVSSQFFTGLLFILPLLREDSRLFYTSPLESAPYVEITRGVLSRFGIRTEAIENGWFIPGGQRFCAARAAVEGDWSNGAHLAAFGEIGGSVSVTGLNEESLQGDRVCLRYFAALKEGAPTVDLSDTPDLAPVLFALAALENGAVFTGTRRLSIKESDRGRAMAEELAKCGARLAVEENRVTVEKAPLKKPDSPLSSRNDHRVAMALALVLSRTGGVLEGAECVKKSFPGFWDALRQLHIEVQEK